MRDVSNVLVLSTKPFAGYEDFDACVAENSDRDDPEAYCAAIMRRVEEKARIYVRDPSKAPPGVQLNTGPRGGLWFDSASVPKRSKPYKPTKMPKAPKGKAPKKPKEEKPPKREIGQHLRGPEDLPKSVQMEDQTVQANYLATFNAILDKGGSEADALAAAKLTVPKRSSAPPKQELPPKRKVGTDFQGAEDPNLPRAIQQESPEARATWVKTFNATLAKSGSEADAIHAANLTLPVRSNPKSPASRDPKKAASTTEPAKRKELDMPEDEPQATRAMIALYLNPTIAEMLAVLPTIESATSGIELEDADSLHITLAYYPVVQPKERDTLIQRAAQIANSWAAPRTEIEGLAQFFASEDDPIPYVLLVDPTSLYGMHESLCYYEPSGPQPAKNHGYIPHITLAYAPRGTSIQFAPPAVPPLVFDRVSVVFDNEERHDFRFSYGDGSSYWTMRSRTERTEKVDDGSDVSDPSPSPRPLEVSRHRSEDMNTNETINATTQSPAGLSAEDQSLEKAGRRVNAFWKEQLSKAFEIIRGAAKWANYDDDEDDEKEAMEKALRQIQDASSSFVVFKDHEGQDRWLAYSSNGFEDREREIVATSSLENVVARADESGVRGPLRLFHIKTGQLASSPSLADIGDCDFQAIQGRFLIESGTFRDTELAHRSLDYFKSTDEKLGVSIGFTHPKEAFDGKVYNEITAIVERSVLPHSLAANPWTAFTTLKGEPMDATKSSWLERVAGKDLATTIIQQADSATKNLEGSVSFKENAELTGALESLNAQLKDASPETRDAYATLVKSIVETPAPVETPEEKKEADKPSETSPFDQDAFLAKIGELVAPIKETADKAVSTAEQTASSLADLGNRLKSLEDGVEAEKAARTGAEPRGAGMFRASGAVSNVADEDAAKSLIGDDTEQPVSPVAGYVSDLLGGRVPVSP